MSKLNQVSFNSSEIAVLHVLRRSESMLGKTPNMIKAMANSPGVADLYLTIQASFKSFSLSPALIELISITVAELNACHYCLCAHHAKAMRYGITKAELTLAREAKNEDRKTASALEFVREVIMTRGNVASNLIDEMHLIGWTDAEMAELIAVTTLNIFPNYFNKLNQTELDFPSLEA